MKEADPCGSSVGGTSHTSHLLEMTRLRHACVSFFVIVVWRIAPPRPRPLLYHINIRPHDLRARDLSRHPPPPLGVSVHCALWHLVCFHPADSLGGLLPPALAPRLRLQGAEIKCRSRPLGVATGSTE